jgi:hypothetical protein
MKNNSTPIPGTHKKSKSKLTSPSSNNFSEKYLQLTKERTFANTPKKSSQGHKEMVSPRDSRDWKNDGFSSKKKLETPYASRNQKININMEIKNFNIYSSNTNENTANKELKKKKLHKKTVSCLNNAPHK